MRYHIGPEGPRDAKLAIVAEKPGRAELDHLLAHQAGQRCGFSNCLQAERPLVGPSGNLINNHLLKIGTLRQAVYLTNAVKDFDSLGNPKTAEVIDQQAALFQELSALPNLNCIVAMGQAALLSLTNFHYSDILRRRGSVLESAIGIKLVPTVHPAFYMRGEWRYQPIVEFDLKRALEQSSFPEIRRPARYYLVAPSFDQAVGALRNLIDAEWISFDIETRGQYITCIAFSDQPGYAFCVPIMYGNRKPYWSLEEEIEIWKLIQIVLSQKRTRYVTQNGLFDCWHLWRHGIETPFMGTGFDTMYAHRLIAPDLPHSLAFLTSIYTDEPYYKDESGRWDAIPVSDEQFWQYNCKDAAVTLEVAAGEMADLEEFNLLDYYRQQMQPQWDALMKMRQIGMKVDRSKVNLVSQQLTDDINRGHKELEQSVGWVPNTKSWKDMGKLFDQLKIRYDTTPTGRPKSDKEHLYTYSSRSSEAAQKALGICLDITANRTLRSNFTSMALDADDFYHPALDLSKAVTGRSASEGEEEGGPQIQNIPKRMRVLFIPDDSESCIICPDLKQAEKMYVAWDSRDELLIRAFLNNKDVHRVTACVIFRNWLSTNLPPDDMLASIKTVCDKCATLGEKSCNHSERYMGKQGGLAFQYKMGPRKFVTTQAKQGVFITEAFARAVQSRVVSNAQILWHERVADQLRRTSWLENPLGRKRNFYGLFDDEMVRKGLSWLAQSTIGDITHRAMIFLQRHLPKGARLFTEAHDSLPVVCKTSLESEVRKLIETAFYCPITLHGRELVIPVDITSGPNWGEQK